MERPALHIKKKPPCWAASCKNSQRIISAWVLGRRVLGSMPGAYCQRRWAEGPDGRPPVLDAIIKKERHPNGWRSEKTFR